MLAEQENARELIREQLKETPEKSDRQIAEEFKVSPTTAGTIRKDMENSGQVSKLDTSIGADGKEYPRERKPVTIMNPTPREERALQENPAILNKIESGQAVTPRIEQRYFTSCLALF